MRRYAPSPPIRRNVTARSTACWTLWLAAVMAVVPACSPQRDRVGSPSNQPISVEAADVSPILECVAPRSGGGFLAFFGYRNAAAVPRTVPAGDENYFYPGEPDRGQPTTFPVGRSNASIPAFAVAGGAAETLVWRLGSRTASATAKSKACKDGSSLPELGAAVAITSPTRGGLYYSQQAQLQLEGTADGTIQSVRVTHATGTLDAALSARRDRFTATVPLAVGINTLNVTGRGPSDLDVATLTVVRLAADTGIEGDPSVTPTTVIKGSSRPTTVTVRAPGATGLRLARRTSVAASDGAFEAVAAFHDDGLDGDEVAGDGIQTARASFGAMEVGLVRLWLTRSTATGDVDVAPVGLVRIAEDFNAQDLATATSLLTDLKRMSAQPRSAIVAAALQSDLVADARAVDAGLGVSVSFKKGFAGHVSLSPDGSRGAISNREVYLTRQYLRDIPTVGNLGAITSLEVPYLESLLARNDLQAQGFRVNAFESSPGRPLVDRELTLASLSGLNRYAFVLLATHGDTTYDWPERITRSVDLDKDEIAFQRLLKTRYLSALVLLYTNIPVSALDLSNEDTKLELLTGELMISDADRVGVTDRFLANHLGTFPPNSVVMGQFCVGARTPRLWTTLRDKGVAFFTGYDVYVPDGYANLIGVDFLNCLLATRDPKGAAKTVRACYAEQKLADKVHPPNTAPAIRCSKVKGGAENLGYCTNYDKAGLISGGSWIDGDHFFALSTNNGDDITLAEPCPDGRWNAADATCCPEGDVYESTLGRCTKRPKNTDYDDNAKKLVCKSGFAQCASQGSVALDGCPTDTNSDPQNCGGCGNVSRTLDDAGQPRCACGRFYCLDNVPAGSCEASATPKVTNMVSVSDGCLEGICYCHLASSAAGTAYLDKAYNVCCAR